MADDYGIGNPVDYSHPSYEAILKPKMPEFGVNQWALILDMLGKGFAPKNPFANIGTMLAQSTIAQQALERNELEKKRLLSMLSNIYGIQPDTAVKPVSVYKANIAYPYNPLNYSGGLYGNP